MAITLLVLVCLLALPVALPPAQGQGASGKATAANALDRAGALLDAGDSPGAERLCRAFLVGHDRSSAAGRSASYLLASALRAEGRPAAALAEAESLLQSLRKRTASASPDDVSADEVAALRDTLRAEVRQNQAAAGQAQPPSDAALRIVTEADAARAQGRPVAAYRLYLKAYDRLSAAPAAPSGVRLTVERAYLAALSQKPPEVRRPALDAFAAQIARTPDASPPERGLALGALDDLAGDDPLTPAGEPTPAGELLARAARAALADPASTPDALALRDQAGKIVYRLDLRAAIRSAARAVKAEEGSDWQTAAAGYGAVVQSCDGAEAAVGHADRFVSRLRSEAARSAPLLEGLAAQGAAPTGCAFLGVDHTVGSDWVGTLGTEGWVLFAPHGDDLCGGPHVQGGSFSYRAYLGDPANPARRWRDPPGPARFPGADLPLADPGVPGETVISYLDDNGEDYPKGAGPDLYVDLSVPSGRHLLTLPLHYDLHVPEAHYGLYLLADGAAGSPQKADTAPKCLASLIVSTHDEPGMARLAVPGPARYTLLMRRLSSENANLPALFLDPDLRGTAPTKIADDLSSEQAGGTDLSTPPSDDNVAALEDLARQYSSDGADWPTLAATATKLGDARSLSPAQQVAAAAIAWHAQERTPLAAGGVLPAFRRYLALRFPPPPPSNLLETTEAAWQRQKDELQGLAHRLRSEGRIRLAEAADDAAWVVAIRQAQASQGAALSPDRIAQNTLFRQMWSDGPHAYLAVQSGRVGRGDDGTTPQPVETAIDVQYAASKARAITAALLAPDPVPPLLAAAGVDPKTPAVPVGSAKVPGELPLQLARVWVDGLTDEAAPAGGATAVTPALRQPAGLIVFIAACQPLLTGTGTPAGPETPSLRSDEKEALARALINQDIFPTGHRAANLSLAAALLHAVKAHDPKYARLDQVDALLGFLNAPPN